MPLNTYRNNPDYPDRYTRNKNWKKIIPIQGRPVQAAELTEIQSILQDNIKQGFDTLFKNGSVIQGLRISIVSIELVSGIKEPLNRTPFLNVFPPPNVNPREPSSS